MSNWKESLGKRVIVVLFSIAIGGTFSQSYAAQTYQLSERDGETFTSIRNTGTRADLGQIFMDRDDADDSTDNVDDVTLNLIHVPFEFYFFGRRIHTLVPTSNFFLTTNPNYACTSDIESSCTVVSDSVLNAAGNDRNHQGGIYPFWTDTINDFTTGSGVFYEVSGASGNQVLTIEFSRLPLDYESQDLDSLSAQVKLFESDGSIEFIYQRGPDDPTGSNPATVGIAATAHYLTESSTTRYYSVQDLDTTTPAASDSDFETFDEDRTTNIRPADGQVYRFTPDFYLPDPDDLSGVEGTNISYTLPEAIYARGEVSYELMGLPSASGISFDDDRDVRTLSCTGCAALTETTLTYSATGPNDEGNDVTVSQTFTLTIGANSTPNLVEHDIAGSNIVVVQNSPIESMGLPHTITGNAPFTYSISPSLPAGLVLDTSNEFVFEGVTRVEPFLYGTPTETMPTTEFTYTVTDFNGETAFLPFTITVTAQPNPQLTAPAGNQDFVFMPGQEVQEVSRTLNPFTGGTGVIYALVDTPALPTGFTFTASSRVLAGDIPADTSGDDNFGPTTYTYTATDELYITRAKTFTIEIRDAIPMAPDIPGDPFTFAQGIAIDDVTLPVFTSSTTHNPTLTYDITNLPAGLTSPQDSRTFSGTPSPSALGSHTVTYEATDGADEVTTIFTINIIDDNLPVPPTVRKLDFNVEDGVVNATLPSFTGGDEMLTYSLTDGSTPVTNLVGGRLTYDPTDRSIMGTLVDTPNDDSDSATYTYTATDPDTTTTPDVVPIDFTINILDARPAFAEGRFIRNISSTQEATVSATLPEVATTGSGTVVYSLSPDLPNGLNFNENSRLLSGASSVTFPTTPFTYSATDQTDGDVVTLTFTITISAFILEGEDTQPVAPTARQDFTFMPGQEVSETLAPFTGGNGTLVYALVQNTVLPNGLSFNPNTLELLGMLDADTPADDSAERETYTYMATDANGDTATTTFTITIVDELIRPSFNDQFFTLNQPIRPMRLPVFMNADPTTSYTLAPLPDGLSFVNQMLRGTPLETVRDIEVTYTATDGAGDTAFITFCITIVDAPDLLDATASVIPSLGANIATLATQVISSRVEVALSGLSSGIDIQTLDGNRFRLNSNDQQQNQTPSETSGFPVRFGVWYSATSDDVGDTQSNLTWTGTTDSTNIGFDVGLDIAPFSTLVVGVLQNSTSTSATYRNPARGGNSTLAVDFDTTAYYLAFGYDFLDAWYVNGSASSTLTDSAWDVGIPAYLSYHTFGATFDFEVADALSLGFKIESLRSDIGVVASDTSNYAGLDSESTQIRMAVEGNYQFEVGRSGNGKLIPNFDFGFRDLDIESSIGSSPDMVARELTTAPLGGAAMESGFGLDYLHMRWGLSLGLDFRSIAVDNYSADSLQWHVRWESGKYGQGFAFQLTPHALSETLGGVDALYSSSYDQYQSLIQRQYGSDTKAKTDGLDFEMGYGISIGYGTVTPYLKATNVGVSNSQSRVSQANPHSQSQEIGLRYATPTGLNLTAKLTLKRTPDAITSALSTLGLSGYGYTGTQDERSLSFTSSYSF